MSRLFDTVVMVDWSAASTPSPVKPSADAIWFAVARDGVAAPPVYCRTRAQAMALLADLLAAEVAAGRRTLAGFDFPFGWPRGLAAAITGLAEGLALWDWLADAVQDAPDNRNNRFAVAARMNAALPGVGPFWGRPATVETPGVPEKGSARHGHGLPERRLVEDRVRSAQPCWKLYTTGSVGSQALLGVAALSRLRRDPRLADAAAVWPFETGLVAPNAPVTLAEIYPSLLAADVKARADREIKDAAQVRLIAERLAALDGAGALAGFFAGPADLAAGDRATVAREEAWILGVGHEAALRAPPRSGAAPSVAQSSAAQPPPVAQLLIASATAAPSQPAAPPAASPPAASPPAKSAPVASQSPAAPPLRDDCFALPPGVDWTPVDVALAALRDGLSCVCAPEAAPLADACGRILAQDARALRDHPAEANSAVDGYGFAHAAMGRGALPLLSGRAAAGAPWSHPVPPGAALRILTGAALPAGVDTVVLQEDCAVEGDLIRFEPRLKPGANTRRAGENLRADDVAAPAGRRLTPADLAQIAAGGLGSVVVRRPLRVGVLSTGDEVVEPGAPAGPGALHDSNRPMLLALLRRQGFAPVDLGIAPDDADAVRAALDRGVAQADAILTSGGASAGDEDHMSRTLRAHGRMTVWRIAVKPGRPLALGLWRGVPVFGLPGNPVAAFVCALVFAWPALSKLAGADWPEPRAFTVPAAFAKRKKAGRREYLRARLNADGAAEAFHSEGSGLIGGLSWAEGLVELPDGALDVAPGDPVRFLPYASFGA